MKNNWEFPTIKRTHIIPDWLIAYRLQSPIKKGISATHFFLDDFRFEPIWNNPEGSREHLATEVVLSPDFSLYRDWPLALQIWNTYRNRWCGAFWQSQGYSVIPTVSWSGPESYDFCFEGCEPGGVVAITTVGLERNEATRSYFHAGFYEMIQRLSPKTVLCYGKMEESVRNTLGARQLANIITYPTLWDKKRKEIAKTKA